MNDRRKDRNTKIKHINIYGLFGVMLILCMIICFFYYYIVREVANQQHSYLQISATEDQIRDLSLYIGKHEVTQEIQINEDQLVEFNILFQRDMSVPAQDYIRVELLNTTGNEIIEQWDIQEASIEGVDYKQFKLSVPLNDIRGNHYLIKVSSNENCHTFPVITKYDSYTYKANVDGKKIFGTLVFNLQANNSFLKNIYAIFSILICVGVFLFGIMCIFHVSKIEIYFLIIGLFMGSMYVLLFPPSVAPDEHGHIATAYADTNVLLGREKTDINGNVYVRKTDAAIEDRSTLSLENMAYYYNMLFQPSDKEITSYDRGPLSVPIFAHLPQTIGVVIGNVFGLNGLITLYIGKIMGLLFYILCVSAAIHIMPWGKMILAVIALFPMSLELAASFSYDCVVNGLSFLFIAYTLHMIYDKKIIEWKDWLFLVLIGIWMAPCKFVYAFICGIIFAIPENKFRNKKSARLLKILFIICIAVFTMSIRSASLQGVITAESGESSVGWPIQQILADPVKSIGVLFLTYFAQSEYYLGTIVGQSLGWFQINISWVNIIGFLLCLSYAVYADKNTGEYLKTKQKVLFVILSIIMLGAIVLSMWMDFTPTYWKNVAGVQGRYFLPFLPMLMLCIKNKYTLYHRKIENKILIGMCILEILTLFDVWRTILQ